MSDDLQELKIEMASFTAKVTEWMNSTKEYRTHLCGKIDKIDNQLSNHITEVTKKINELPCRERSAWHDNTKKQIKWLWIMLSGSVLAIIGDWVRRR